MKKKAIVTLAIGKKYESMFTAYCMRSWQKYCAKFDYDLIAINRPLDESQRAKERSPAWQKLLILSQDWSRSYDQVIWVDTDIIINSENSPDIAHSVPLEKIGAVETYSIPTRAINRISLKRLYAKWKSNGINYIDNITPGLYYENRGIPGGHLDSVVQTGVFACSATHHRDIFEHIYNSYEDHLKGGEYNYEMPAMSYELVKNNVVHWMPSEYNFCVNSIVSAFYPFIFSAPAQNLPEFRMQCLKNIYDLGYFIHFAGCAEWMPALHSQIEREQDIRD